MEGVEEGEEEKEEEGVCQGVGPLLWVHQVLEQVRNLKKKGTRQVRKAQEVVSDADPDCPPVPEL